MNYREEWLVESGAAYMRINIRERIEVATRHNDEMEKWRDSLKRINALLEEAIANEKQARSERNTAVAYIHAKHEQRCRDMKKKPTHDEEFERVLADARKAHASCTS